MTRPAPEKVIACCLMMAVLAVFLQVAGHDFIVFDDGAYITNNNHVKSGLTRQNILWAFRSMEVSNWHPLTWLSHMLDSHLYGLHPAGHHLTSLFFHVATALLVFLVMRESTGRRCESALVAALFGLHPLHVESVAWVSERKDVLSAFFWMTTLLAYIRFSRRPGHGRYALILLSFSMGLMAKPMLVTLPFVLLLMDFWPLGRMRRGTSPQGGEGLWRLVREKVPLFILSGASCALTYIAQSESGSVTAFEVISFKIRVLNAFLSYGAYLIKMFYPHDLAVFYPHPAKSLPLWQGIGAGLFLLFISAWIFKKRRDYPFLLTGWLWYLGTLVPVIGIIQVGGQSMADRYTYLPSIGIFVMVVWGVAALTKKVRHRNAILAVLSFMVLFSLSMVTRSYLDQWRDSETLFRHAISVTKRNYVAHSNLGTALLNKGRLDEASVEFKKALEIWPEYPDAHNNLGVVMARKGLIEEARAHYQEAIKANPNHFLAHLNMGNALVELGRPGEALPHYLKALLMDPEAGAVHNALGVAFAQLNRMNEAVIHLHRAIDFCPKCPEPLNNLGRLLAMRGDLSGAIQRLQRAVELQPDYAEAHNNLGLVFLQIGAMEEAAYHFATALHYRPDYPKARRNLQRAALKIAETLKDEKVSAEEGKTIFPPMSRTDD